MDHGEVDGKEQERESTVVGWCRTERKKKGDGGWRRSKAIRTT